MNKNDYFSNNSIMKNFIKDTFLIILGSVIMAFAISQFLLPNQLSTGGFSGIATILYYFLNIPMGTTVFILNLPLFIVACFVLGRKFLIRAIAGTAFLSIFLNILEKFPAFTSDKFLACIYGGVLIGLGTALILRASASTGGSDLIASITRKINPRISTSNMIMILDVVIVLLNVVFFKTIEVGLYSAIAIFLMGKIIDLIFEGINFSKVMFIVSDKHERIADVINNAAARGVTRIIW